ncbi:MAG: leucine-rich repeat domain-containing protein [Clostridia bacterium]|nr:leucine-rich repeat domain-containing protein [Clostridia bacterium]
MKKASTLLLIIAIFALTAISLNAAEIASGTCGVDLSWTLNDAGTLIISGTGAMDNDWPSNYDLVPWKQHRSRIVNVIVEDGVTTIGDGAFSNCLNLKSITLPEGITYLGSHSLQYCSQLTDIQLPKSLVYIGKMALYHTSLSEIVVPDNASLEMQSVSYIPTLKNVHLGKETYLIDYFNFVDLPMLEKITVDAQNPYYESDEYGVLYLKGKKTLLKYPMNSPLEAYVIPDTVNTISSNAFSHANNIKKVTIPSSVVKLEDGAFGYCRKISDIRIPDSVTYIGSSAFSGMDGITSIIIPDSVKTLRSAFTLCRNLKTVKIGSGVETMDIAPFMYCESLERISVHPDNQSFSSDEYGALFNKNKTVMIAYPPENKSSKYVIPSTVKTIENQAFRSAKHLNEIIIPNSVTIIHNGAFFECQGLESIILGRNVNFIDSFAFYDCNSIKNIYYYLNKESFGEIIILHGNDYIFNANLITDFTSLPGDTDGNGEFNLDDIVYTYRFFAGIMEKFDTYK